ncbi:MAG TPA: POTRA domain-containing protein [Edaphobacter sp.]|nr:POTRA domain-containing protein [Edaphobacter sp.]
MGWVGLLLASVALGQTAPILPPSPSGQTAAPDARPMAVPQTSEAQTPRQSTGELPLGNIGPGLTTTVWQWKGLRVEKIEFEGVVFDKEDTLPSELEQKVGAPLDPEKVRQSMRRLFVSGRYRDIMVRGVRHGDGVTLIFAGPPRYYVGRVTIEGVKSERLTSLLEFGTKLTPGAALAEGAVPAGTEGIKQILQQQGFYEPTVSVRTTIDAAGNQMNVFYTVNIGPQARVGQVSVVGTDPGLTAEEFRKKGKLKQGSKVSRDTTSNALTKLRSQFEKRDRLEATVSLQKQTYVGTRKQVDYEFHVNQGPEVKVLVEGAKFSKSRLHLLVPIFEEGTIDNDLMNEGVHNIRDYMLQQGYFDATVDVKVIGEDTPSERVVFTVDRGVKHKVVAVDLKGNKYFEDDLLRERMQVKKADAYLRSGRYSPALVTSDVSAIQALYRANGFDKAEVKTEVQDSDTAESGKPLKVGQISVTYIVTEGLQQKFGKVALDGVDASRLTEIKGLMNAQEGQPFSLVTLSGDRDAVLGYYLSHGFDQAKVEIKQQKENADATKTDVSLNVVEGHQVFVGKVMVSGIEHTKPYVVQNRILVHPGDPLDQSALLETQRNLYNVALFNEVVTAVQNPRGDEPQKNVLVQVTEAKRWNVTYGFGFEAQTGTPSTGTISEASCIQLGLNPCNDLTQEGRGGVSPRVSLDVSRINFLGTDDSLTLHSTYGLLEQIAVLTFQNPHLLESKVFSAAASGGYTNVRDITTFASSKLQGDLRLTQRLRKDTFIYDFQYRRVKVDPNSLQVSADLIPLQSQPVRVGGPGVTWLHDTRSPNPLDAVKGFYTTVQMFLASSKFGSQTDFWRVDGTNSTYYQFGKQKYVLARSTRIGYEQASGANPNIGSNVCEGVLLTTNPSCNPIPLPERLYAGGASSHRGFPINGAGPRDLQTGFPVGGSATLVNSTELRMPAPMMPLVGDSINFVLFHDMGNVFQNASDMFPSFLRFNQPNRHTCTEVLGVVVGTCSFNYFSHAVGLGARYKTPVGPVRVDFSYNLNPPIYPVIYDFNNNPPHVGQANHFNFFFSIGQSF